MSSEDDHEASAQRIDSLERELESVREELSAAKAKLEGEAEQASDLEGLMQRIEAMSIERDDLARSVSPARREAAIALLVLVSVALVSALLFQARLHDEDADAARASAASAASQLSTCEQALDHARAGAPASTADGVDALLRAALRAAPPEPLDPGARAATDADAGAPRP